MSLASSRITEAEIGDAVLRILAKRKNGEATVATIRKRLPGEVRLSLGDQAGSPTRGNEELWEQQVRNLRSHSKTDGNPFKEGYLVNPSRGLWKLTPSGNQRAAASRPRL